MNNQVNTEFLQYVRNKDDGTKYKWRYLEMKERFEDIQTGYFQHQNNKWHCRECNRDVERVQHDYIFRYYLSDDEKKIIVRNAPYKYCSSCKGYYENLRIYAAVERILDQEVSYRLGKRHSLPDTIEMDFEEFLTPLE